MLGTELVLEPNDNPAVMAFQSALRAQGIPLPAVAVDEIAAEHARLERLGVAFRMSPTSMRPVTIAVFDDTCGNLIRSYQV